MHAVNNTEEALALADKLDVRGPFMPNAQLASILDQHKTTDCPLRHFAAGVLVARVAAD